MLLISLRFCELASLDASAQGLSWAGGRAAGGRIPHGGPSDESRRRGGIGQQGGLAVQIPAARCPCAHEDTSLASGLRAACNQFVILQAGAGMKGHRGLDVDLSVLKSGHFLVCSQIDHTANFVGTTAVGMPQK